MTRTYPWLTESIRFSLLGVAEGGKISWHAFTGKDAESVTSRPAQQVTIEEGPFLSGRLVITSQPGRVDVTLSAMPLDPNSHPSLGEFSPIMNSFGESLMQVKLPTAARVAFGAVLNMFPSSLEESGAAMRELIPTFQIDKGATDISLQFNLPKKLPKVSGITLNRLSKYSQMLSQVVIYGGSGQSTRRDHVLQLELDINTPPDYIIPGASVYSGLIPAIFAEAGSFVS